MLRAAIILGALVALAGPAAADEAPCRLHDLGCFLDADGQPTEADDAYRRVVHRDSPNYLRAALEEGLALGAGTAWYWIDRERQVADWDFPSWKQRLTLEAWRFDNNPFGINFAWHAFNGAGFHVLARSNDLSLAGAFGYGVASSMAWEILFEFREKVSVNDAIVTSGAGVGIGEFVHWLGRYVQGGPGWARWSLGFWHTAHDALDDRGPRDLGVPRDNLGLRSDIWHRFRLGYAGGRTTGDVTMHRVGVEGRLVAIPGYLRPGRFDRWFFDGNVTALSLAVTGADGSGVDLVADTTVLGYYQQRIPRGAGVGNALMIGANLAYRYRRETVGDWQDRLALMHLPGPAVDVHARWSRVVAAARLRLSPDFAGIHAPLNDEWNAAHPGEVGKTILRKQGYYFGWGYSARAELELELPRVRAGAALLIGRYDSQEGLDRSQEGVEVDVDLTDTVIDQDAWLRIYPLATGAHLELRYRRQHRRSTQDQLELARTLERVTLGLGLTF
jgi:hypothetical protein